MADMMNKIRNAVVAPDLGSNGIDFMDMLFGVNAEITRKGFFGGLSAEMLNNRKLYAGDDVPGGWECSNFERISDQPGLSLCGSKFVVLHSGEMHQTSDVISLRAGRTYEAAVWVKAYSENVSVTFGIDGCERTFVVEKDEKPYTALSFVFEGCDIDNGTFSVKAEGDIAVFEVSLMPTDHFYGMRRDVIEHLRTAAPTSIRFPGGCAADHFDWKESLKSREFRVPSDGSSKSWFLFRNTYDQDCLDIGLNEFMMLCRELNAEPEYTVSLILSDGEDARRLVEYCNGNADTEYGAKRQALGFDAFDIRLWFIGNEAYFFGGEEFGGGAAAARRTNEIINAMRTSDKDISAVIGLTWGNNYHQWNFDFMANIDCQYEYVSYHNYIGILPDASQGENGMATCEILEDNFRDGEDFGLNFYKNKLFRDDYSKVRICADEWNYTWGRDSSNALFFSNALQFHFLANYAEKYHIDRAEFFMPVNEGMITVHGAETKFESTGEMFRLLKPHCGGKLIKCASDEADLDILCTMHEGDSLYISAVNRSSEPIRICAEGYDILSCSEIRTGEYSFECNDFDVIEPDDAVVYGHSMIFMTLSPRK